MAAWQTDYFIVPQTKLVEFYGKIPAIVSENDFYKKVWWEGVPAPNRSEIESILPRFKTLDGVTMFGSDAGNRIHIVDGDDAKPIEEIFVRVDLSNNHHSFVQSLAEFAKKHGWCFVSASSGEILMPEFETIINDLNHSDAQGFVTDIPAWQMQKAG